MIFNEDSGLTKRARALGLGAGVSVLLVIDDAGTQRYALDVGTSTQPGGQELIDLGLTPADAARRLREIAEAGPVSTAEWLSPAAATALFTQLTGRPLRRQRWQQWAARGDVRSRRQVIVVEVAMIDAADVRRLAREGLPNRGKGGRPRKDSD